MDEKYIDLAVQFTETYQKYQHTSPAIREIMCTKVLYPAGLLPLREGDRIAGRENMNLGLNSDNPTLPIVFHPRCRSQVGYSANLTTLRRLAEAYPHRIEEVHALIDFWKKETTFVKIRNEAPPEIRDYLFPPHTTLDADEYMRCIEADIPLGAGFISGSFDTRLAGIMPDFRLILASGIPGLAAQIAHGESVHGKNDFYTAARLSLELAVDTLAYYRQQAVTLLETAAPEHRDSLTELARILAELQFRAPQTLHEALQLAAVFSVLSGIDNYGRLDVYFGDYLVNDLADGRLTEETAIDLICGFWDFISDNCSPFDSRVILGGLGRPNEANANRFALLALEATRRRHAVKPVVTLRLYEKQDPALFEKALDLIAEGCIYPTLYNDDIYVEACMKSMHVPYEDAVDYAPLGCGELILVGKSIGSPNSTLRMLKGLEAALHNGCDAVDGNRIGIESGDPADFDTFEKLFDAFLRQMDARLVIDARAHAWTRMITQREAAFVTASLFSHDCIAKGKALLEGGIRYYGANLEGFGLTNTIDSLAVIKKLVYEEKKYTLPELIHILDVNFEGYEADRQAFLRVDKFGNDQSWVDDLKLTIERFINERADFYGRQCDFHYCTVANVNPGGIELGPYTAASADGRRCGEPFALSNSPMPGADVSGLTAMLCSTAKSAPENGGYVTNMNISRRTIVEQRAQVAALFRTYFAMGGLQLNVNCFSRGDLEKACANPQAYRSLIVRVSGYSARFIDLDKITQIHIMERTLY